MRANGKPSVTDEARREEQGLKKGLEATPRRLVLIPSVTDLE